MVVGKMDNTNEYRCITQRHFWKRITWIKPKQKKVRLWLAIVSHKYEFTIMLKRNYFLHPINGDVDERTVIRLITPFWVEIKLTVWYVDIYATCYIRLMKIRSNNIIYIFSSVARIIQDRVQYKLNYLFFYSFC